MTAIKQSYGACSHTNLTKKDSVDISGSGNLGAAGAHLLHALTKWGSTAEVPVQIHLSCWNLEPERDREDPMEVVTKMSGVQYAKVQDSDLSKSYKSWLWAHGFQRKKGGWRSVWNPVLTIPREILQPEKPSSWELKIFQDFTGATTPCTQKSFTS